VVERSDTTVIRAQNEPHPEQAVNLFIVAFRSAKVAYHRATFAEQKATFFVTFSIECLVVDESEFPLTVGRPNDHVLEIEGADRMWNLRCTPICVSSGIPSGCSMPLD
jgi:hypothetical protein